MMKNHKVKIIGDSSYEFNVEFNGPEDSKLDFHYSFFSEFIGYPEYVRYNERCLISGIIM